MLWTRGGTFNTCAAAERMTLNLTGDVTVYNSTREEKHDRGGQPKHVTIFMADGWLKFWVKLVFFHFFGNGRLTKMDTCIEEPKRIKLEVNDRSVRL